MPWFKVDDKVWSHPKFAALSDAAQALWLRAGSYAAEKLSDGYIDTRILTTLLRGKPKTIAELVTAGMWVKVRDGIQFHDWLEYQPSAASVNKEREQARERMANVRANKKANESRSSDSPDPVPVPDLTDVTNFPGSSPDSTVRAERIDPQLLAVIRDREAKAVERAHELGIQDPESVWNRLERTLRGSITFPDAIRLAAVILDCSPTFIGNPEGYIATACRKSPDQVRQWADDIDVQIGAAA